MQQLLAQFQFHLLTAFGPAFLGKARTELEHPAFDRKAETATFLLHKLQLVDDNITYPIQALRIKSFEPVICLLVFIFPLQLTPVMISDLSNLFELYITLHLAFLVILML